MPRYRIIDEPQSKAWGEHFIVDPTVILFAAFIVPLFWDPPFLGRYWIPPLWLIANGYLLGSATLGKEILTILGGMVAWVGVLLVTAFTVNSGLISAENISVNDYMRIIQFGVFFLMLYLVIFQQSRSYQLFDYVRGQ